MFIKVIVVAMQIIAELVSGFLGVMCVAAALFAQARNKDTHTLDAHVPKETIMALFLFGSMCLVMRIMFGLYHRGLLMG